MLGSATAGERVDANAAVTARCSAATCRRDMAAVGAVAEAAAAVDAAACCVDAVCSSSFRSIESSGAGLFAIGNGTPLMAQDFVETFAVPFPVFTDPSRSSYQLAGLQRKVRRRAHALGSGYPCPRPLPSPPRPPTPPATRSTAGRSTKKLADVLLTVERPPEVDQPSPRKKMSVPVMGRASTYTNDASLRTRQRHPGEWAHACRAAPACCNSRAAQQGQGGIGGAHLRAEGTAVGPADEGRSVRAPRAALGDALAATAESLRAFPKACSRCVLSVLRSSMVHCRAKVK